jgi:large subunit ribosomal protein L3
MQGLIGRKIGMTRFFDAETGREIPVTVIHAGANVVHQLKTAERDGYGAVQLGFGMVAESKVNKPQLGHFKKHKSVPTRVIREFKLDASDQLVPGQKVGVEVFDNVKFVDVTGVTKGRGFTGTIKRHNFKRGRETHGNTNHREPGSIGQNTYPGRVFPGVRMAGQYGNSQQTMKALALVGVEKETGLIYVRGSVPGANRGIVLVKKTTQTR